MKPRPFAGAVTWLAIALVAATTARAQTNTPATATTPTPPSTTAEPATFADLAKQVKQPVDWFSWGADLRVRNEYYHNIVSLVGQAPLNEQDVIRFRARLWASIAPVTNLTFNGRLSAEPREWIKPAFVSAVKGESGMEWRYGIADNLNVKWSNILDQPLSITAGRQDILLGDYYDWWLVADGTPGDGSWTLYLDSVRLTAQARDIQTKFDLIYIYQNPEPGDWLPTIGDSTDYPVTDQREQGVILYVSNKSIPHTQLDAYAIYKHDDRETFTVAGVQKTPGDNADLGTVGGKLTGTPWEQWQYSVEGAYQFGTKEDKIAGVFDSRTVDAYGGKLKLTYLCLDRFSNQVSLVGEFLSGDDPNTGKDEMFDILWGRWPRWSELYIYSYIAETGGRIAQLNNLGRVGPSWSCNPTKDLTASVMYNALFAPQDTPTRTVAPTSFSNDGSFRGHYLQAVLKQQFTKNVSGHLWGEWVWEGDYYSKRELLTFLRAEVMVTF